jgi:hypothetical protein
LTAALNDSPERRCSCSTSRAMSSSMVKVVRTS